MMKYLSGHKYGIKNMESHLSLLTVLVVSSSQAKLPEDGEHETYSQ